MASIEWIEEPPERQQSTAVESSPESNSTIIETTVFNVTAPTDNTDNRDGKDNRDNKGDQEIASISEYSRNVNVGMQFDPFIHIHRHSSNVAGSTVSEPIRDDDLESTSTVLTTVTDNPKIYRETDRKNDELGLLQQQTNRLDSISTSQETIVETFEDDVSLKSVDVTKDGQTPYEWPKSGEDKLQIEHFKSFPPNNPEHENAPQISFITMNNKDDKTDNVDKIEKIDQAENVDFGTLACEFKKKEDSESSIQLNDQAQSFVNESTNDVKVEDAESIEQQIKDEPSQVESLVNGSTNDVKEDVKVEEPSKPMERRVNFSENLVKRYPESPLVVKSFGDDASLLKTDVKDDKTENLEKVDNIESVEKVAKSEEVSIDVTDMKPLKSSLSSVIHEYDRFEIEGPKSSERSEYAYLREGLENERLVQDLSEGVKHNASAGILKCDKQSEFKVENEVPVSDVKNEVPESNVNINTEIYGQTQSDPESNVSYVNIENEVPESNVNIEITSHPDDQKSSNVNIEVPTNNTENKLSEQSTVDKQEPSNQVINQPSTELKSTFSDSTLEVFTQFDDQKPSDVSNTENKLSEQSTVDKQEPSNQVINQPSTDSNPVEEKSVEEKPRESLVSLLFEKPKVDDTQWITPDGEFKPKNGTKPQDIIKPKSNEVVIPEFQETKETREEPIQCSNLKSDEIHVETSETTPVETSEPKIEEKVEKPDTQITNQPSTSNNKDSNEQVKSELATSQNENESSQRKPIEEDNNRDVNAELDAYGQRLIKNTREALALVDQLCQDTLDRQERRKRHLSGGPLTSQSDVNTYQPVNRPPIVEFDDLEVEVFRVNSELLEEPKSCVLLPDAKLLILDTKLGLTLMDLQTKETKRCTPGDDWRDVECACYMKKHNQILLIYEQKVDDNFIKYLARFDMDLKMLTKCEAPKYVLDMVVVSCRVCYVDETDCIYLAVNTPNNAFIYELNAECRWTEVYNMREKQVADIVKLASVGPVTELLIVESTKRHIILLGIYNSSLAERALIAFCSEPASLCVDEHGNLIVFDRATNLVGVHSRLNFERIRDLVVVGRANCSLSAQSGYLALLNQHKKELRICKY